MIQKVPSIKDLKILHALFCIGPLLMMTLFHFFIKPITISGIMSSMELFSFIGLGLAIINVLVSSYMFKRKVDHLGTDINSKNILEFIAAYIMKWAFIEGAILINILFYFFLDTDPINILLAMALLLVLYSFKPPINHHP